MTPQEFAERITGQEYPFALAEPELAKQHGLVALWGLSDDLLEVDGLFRDEASAWDGVTCQVDTQGILEINEDGTFCGDEPETIEECRRWVRRYDASIQVKVEWCPDPYLSWRITADDVPNKDKATFVVLEDGEPNCEGLVIRLSPFSETHPTHLVVSGRIG